MVNILFPKLDEVKYSGKATLKTAEENERFLSKANDVLGGFDTLFLYSLLRKITSDIKEASLKLAVAKYKKARVFGKVAILGALGNVFGQLSTEKTAASIMVHR